MRELVGSDELKGSRIRGCDLSGAQPRGVNLSNVKMTDALLFNTEVSGMIGGLKVNGVSVALRWLSATKVRPPGLSILAAAWPLSFEIAIA